MWTMSLMPLSRAARFARRGISMPMISRAGDTMRALIPRISPWCWAQTRRVSSRLMLLSAMMSGMVARPVWQMWRNGITSVWQLGMMWRGKPPKVAAPALPASTMVVTPAYDAAEVGPHARSGEPLKDVGVEVDESGVTILPATSTVRLASALGMSGAILAMTPSSTAMSRRPSSPVDGRPRSHP